MAISFFSSDPVLNVGKQALDGLALRRDTIGNNIANVDTPGYKAQEVTFEGALQRAMKAPSPVSMVQTSSSHMDGSVPPNPIFQMKTRSSGTLRADGNNVDIDQEMSSMVETSLRYSTISSVVSKKLLLLRTIAEK
jgi:flagellar basal-body rod protein FlgB